jgi:hypothetical protein
MRAGAGQGDGELGASNTRAELFKLTQFARGAG